MTITELPVHVEAIADAYKQAVSEVEAHDLALGDTAAKGNAFIGELRERNVEAAQTAERMIQQIKDMTDAEAQAVVAFIVSRDREISRIATDYIKANEPTSEAVEHSNEEIARLWNERSIAQKKAAALFEAIKLSLGVEDDEALAAVIPALPKGKRGAAPGTKRGKMGRKLPAGIHWTVDGEDVGEKNPKDVASLLKVKVSDVRTALEEAYPDTLPNVFEATINGKVVRGVVGEPTTPAADDDNDDDDELGELDFED